MGTVLEDVTSETVDAAHIARRVEDWARRVRSLYGTIGGWLPEGWQVREGKPVFMHEELMRQFGVGRREMPTLMLAGTGGQYGQAGAARTMDHRRKRPNRSEA